MPRSFDDTQPAEAPPVVERQPILADRSYSIILETFERRLRLGELRVGDKLPSERELAARHGISRPSVREGLRVLNALGLIRSSTGSVEVRCDYHFGAVGCTQLGATHAHCDP